MQKERENNKNFLYLNGNRIILYSGLFYLALSIYAYFSSYPSFNIFASRDATILFLNLLSITALPIYINRFICDRNNFNYQYEKFLLEQKKEGLLTGEAKEKYTYRMKKKYIDKRINFAIINLLIAIFVYYILPSPYFSHPFYLGDNPVRILYLPTIYMAIYCIISKRIDLYHFEESIFKIEDEAFLKMIFKR